MEELLELLKGANALGGLGGVLALVVFYYARRDAIQHKAEWQTANERYEVHSEALTDIVKGNTEALATNTAVAREGIQATREMRSEVTELRKSNGR